VTFPSSIRQKDNPTSFPVHEEADGLYSISGTFDGSMEAFFVDRFTPRLEVIEQLEPASAIAKPYSGRMPVTLTNVGLISPVQTVTIESSDIEDIEISSADLPDLVRPFVGTLQPGTPPKILPSPELVDIPFEGEDVGIFPLYQCP